MFAVQLGMSGEAVPPSPPGWFPSKMKLAEERRRHMEKLLEESAKKALKEVKEKTHESHHLVVQDEVVWCQKCGTLQAADRGAEGIIVAGALWQQCRRTARGVAMAKLRKPSDGMNPITGACFLGESEPSCTVEEPNPSVHVRR